jgi:cytochrome c peroxidase
MRGGGRPFRLFGIRPALLAALLTAALPALAEPADSAAARYVRGVRAFTQRVAPFPALLEALPSTPAGTARLRREIDSLRAAYKRVEFLVDYAHPGSSARLNPAPLDRADLSSPSEVAVLPPEGLQILMEIAHEDDPWAQRATLQWLAFRLDMSARELARALEGLVLDDRMVFEAMQNQVVRAMTMGISGFDAPAPARALPETRIALEALRPVIGFYLPELRRRSPALAQRLSRALDAASSRLKPGADFDAFDRLAFLREAGNPLYAALIDAQNALGIATFADLAPLRRPVSVTARNLFDPAFLDPHFYGRTPGERPNPVVAALGRRLFFDPSLSGDGKRSCASCHDPRKAFSDGVPKSPAFDGSSTVLRNAPALTHAAYQADQFWDLREKTLEKQIMHVILGDGEFRSSPLAVLGAVQRNPAFTKEFEAAFPGDPEPVNMGTITKSLAMYLRSFRNFNSPFDRYVRGETGAIDPAAKRGFNLFMGKALCATCHFPPAFNGTVPPRYLESESEVLGAPEKFPAAVPVLDPDLGRGSIHFSPIFRHAFKTPTVRNVALSAPYMHNGGMKTLEDVLDFYNAGGGAGLGLDVPNQTLPSDSLGLSRRDMDDIIAFMESLTDTAGIAGQGQGFPGY